MSPTKNITANPEKNPPTLRQLLERIANYTEDLERRTGNTIEVAELLREISSSLDQISLNQEQSIGAADSLKDAIEANTLKLDDIYGVLLEILEQSHNPLRPLPPMPVGRGNHHYNEPGDLPNKSKAEQLREHLEKHKGGHSR